MNIRIDRAETDRMVGLLQQYFRDELDWEIDQFPAEFLLQFIIERIGPVCYNQGLADAHGAVAAQTERISDALYELELPTE
ncbi:MAG: DUF2164 domain-containing protein [Pseudomonadota bacterium]